MIASFLSFGTELQCLQTAWTYDNGPLRSLIADVARVLGTGRPGLILSIIASESIVGWRSRKLARAAVVTRPSTVNDFKVGMVIRCKSQDHWVAVKPELRRTNE